MMQHVTFYNLPGMDVSYIHPCGQCAPPNIHVSGNRSEFGVCPVFPFAPMYVCVGGFFDPLNLAGGDDPEKVFRLKTAEIKHGRLAMVSFLGELSVLAGQAAGIVIDVALSVAALGATQ